jgi:hypothetical protein
MLPVRFEPRIPAGERPQTYALDRAATGTGYYSFTNIILHYCFTLYYTYIDNFNQSLQNSALLIPQHTYVYCDLVYCYVLEEFWCQLPEDGETTPPKHIDKLNSR